MRNLYQDVTTRIVQEMERGVMPWVRPWSLTPGANVPGNAVSGRPYSGINVILLWLARERGWPVPKFLTYKQATELGGHVRKGEHGTPVYFVNRFVPKAERDSENPRMAAMLKVYTVFNIAQCENLPADLLAKYSAPANHSEERDATIDEFIAATGANVSEGDDSARYIPSIDAVRMPAFHTFKSAANYYATLFHEMGHWTGHASRCARDLKGRFGDRSYAAEELIAELTSAFLCAEFSIDGNIRHADYVGHWIQLLKDDARAFFTAASAAQKAADYLRGKVLSDTTPLAA